MDLGFESPIRGHHIPREVQNTNQLLRLQYEKIQAIRQENEQLLKMSRGRNPGMEELMQRSVSGRTDRRPTNFELFSAGNGRSSYRSILESKGLTFIDDTTDNYFDESKRASLAKEVDVITGSIESLNIQEAAEDKTVADRVAAIIEERKRREEEARKLTDIPQDLLSQFQKIITGPSFRDSQVVAKHLKFELRQKDMKTLRPRIWLNDEIINSFLSLLDNENPQVFCHSSFFLTAMMSDRGYAAVRRWTKRRKIDLFALDLMLVPVNVHNTHWTLVGCDMRNKTITYYDSMSGDGMEYLAVIKEYLIAEHADKKGTDLDASEWKLQPRPPEPVPQQMNGVDCGAFTCVCAMHLARGLPLMYSQSEISQHWRPFLGCSILRGEVLPR